MRVLHEVLDRQWQRGYIGVAEQMVQREQRVCFTSAEIRLQIHYRRAGVSCNALACAGEEVFQACRQVGSGEEFLRVAIGVAVVCFVGDGDGVQVGGEFAGVEGACGYVVFRCDDFAPRLDIAAGVDGKRFAAAHGSGMFLAYRAVEFVIDVLDAVC